MRSIFLALALTLTTSPAFAGEVFYKKVFKDSDSDGSDLEQMVIDTFNAAVKSSGRNPVKTEVAKLKKELEDAGHLDPLSKNDLLLIESGKASAGAYDYEYLVAVPASMGGNGNTVTHAGYFRAHAYLEIGEKVTVSFTDIVDIVNK